MVKRKVTRPTGRRLLQIVAVLATAVLLSCKNPVSAERVIILIDDYLVEGGRYIFYWNGKDDDKRYVEPGDYIIVLEIKDFQEQEKVTAVKGGQPNENNQARFEPGFWQYHELQLPFPNPFKVQSGVNIPILLSGPARVKIVIYKG